MTERSEVFRERYGPWALVAGGSEGVGAAFAHEVAGRGVNVLLLARRQSALDDAAVAIHTKHGVEARTLAVDLATSDATPTIAGATADLEVGLFVYNAGADPDFSPFLDRAIEPAVAMVQRNCVVPLQLCHHFAPPMVERGRGGIVLVSSAGGFYGGPNLVPYSATKAFDIMLGESLWSELKDQGVDVLNLVLGLTDTPELRRNFARRGVLAGEDDTTPIPAAASATDVAAEGIANLANGPTWIPGKELREGIQVLGTMSRRDAVLAITRAAEIMHHGGIDSGSS